ncbi:tyrosine-type recombinase/integrase [Arthrobacter sp. HLT1-20]
MLPVQSSEWQSNSKLAYKIPVDAIYSSLITKASRREQLLIQSLLQQCDGGEVRNVSPVDDSKNSAVGDATSHLPQLAVADIQLGHLSNQSVSEETRVLSRDIASEVGSKPVNTVASNLSGSDSFPLSHGSTVNHVADRPFIPLHLVGAPADLRKLYSQDACQNPPTRRYSGLYIDQSDDSTGPKNMAITKPEQGILVTEAVQVVLKHWAETGALLDESLLTFKKLLDRYATFVTNLGAPSLAEQSEDLAAQWIRAKGRNRKGNIVEPALATMNTRRAALRKFFHDADALDLSDTGLFVRVYVAPRTTGLARPLTKEEAEKVWAYANDAGSSTRRPVMFALLLSGVHSSEVGLITTSDVDIANQRVWAHGSTERIEPRWVKLPEPYFTAVAERLEYLRGWVPPFRSFEEFQITQGTTRRPTGKSQNRAASACKEVFRMAGLHNDAHVTPSSVSLYAGSRMLINGERLEVIAQFLGYASLDSCAKALGYDWKTGEIA